VALESVGEGGNEDGVRRGCRVLLILDLESAVGMIWRVRLRLTKYSRRQAV